MKKNNFLLYVLLTLICIAAIGMSAVAQTTTSQLPNAVTPKFVDIGPISYQTFPTAYGMPIVGEYTIQTLGYSEIRFFVHVFVDNYQTTPIQNAKLYITMFHTIKGGSWSYSYNTINSTVTSYINGYVNEKIIGKTLRILVKPENMPAGPYRVEVSYYLIP
jgi:hypothetical protein